MLVQTDEPNSGTLINRKVNIQMIKLWKKLVLIHDLGNLHYLNWSDCIVGDNRNDTMPVACF